MDKRHILFIALFLLVIGGVIVSRKFIAPKPCLEGVGETVTINMLILKNQWKWAPNPIYVKCGNHVVINIYNQDDYDHGFALDTLGINRRTSPLSTTTVEFDAKLEGEFIFYCSVPCGAGHLNQKGKLIVGAILPPGGTPSGEIQLPGDTTYKLSIPVGFLWITYPAGWYVSQEGFRSANYSLLGTQVFRGPGDAKVEIQPCQLCPVKDGKLDIASLFEQEKAAGRKQDKITIPGAAISLQTKSAKGAEFRLFIAFGNVQKPEEVTEIITSGGVFVVETIERILKSIKIEQDSNKL